MIMPAFSTRGQGRDCNSGVFVDGKVKIEMDCIVLRLRADASVEARPATGKGGA
jgi:hypothetical protein